MLRSLPTWAVTEHFEMARGNLALRYSLDTVDLSSRNTPTFLGLTSGTYCTPVSPPFPAPYTRRVCVIRKGVAPSLPLYPEQRMDCLRLRRLRRPQMSRALN